MYFEYDGYKYPVIINKKNNKNLYIRVDTNLNINITCPYLYDIFLIKRIIKENTNSIIKMINKQKNNIAKNINYNGLLGNEIRVIYQDVKRPLYENNVLLVKDDKMLNKWYVTNSKKIFQSYLDEAYSVFEEKIPYPKLKIRQMKTRYGVCNRNDNSVTLNLELIKKDPKYLKYVIVHELSHFVHFDHSKAFWKTVEKYCPEYKLIRKEMRS